MYNYGTVWREYRRDLTGYILLVFLLLLFKLRHPEHLNAKYFVL
jgi:hypothetical protein